MLLREYLQSVHSISRRKFTDLVDQGKIFLNGKLVNSYKQLIQEDDRLEMIDDRLKETVHMVVSESRIVLFNKPVGYVVSKSDPHNQTIYELLPKEFQGLYYIGRLDKDSHGLLLMTNDPKVVNEFEHPKFEIEKEYIVKIDRPLTSRDAQRMKEGILDEGDLLKVHKVESPKSKVKESMTGGPDDLMTLRLILHEGKKRHIRRIFKAMNYKVVDLQRIREGKFELGNLKLGECKIV
ncbi:MAG: hypothetical protein CO170_03605 [candidate division SR1 bacterium CG_4_9_14_3_um_filter_40_9]|nr:MAG: hypothetical protein CO170_03605 [candidate division SR1 bacterium CG_4_9_14_3_um_filter_40_9]